MNSAQRAALNAMMKVAEEMNRELFLPPLNQAECAAEFNPEAVKQRRLDEEADAEAAFQHDVLGPLLGLDEEGL